MRALLPLGMALILALGSPAESAANELRGSRAKMVRQNNVAREAGYTFVRTQAELMRLVEDGVFVELPGNDDYDTIARHSYALPEVRLFVERLAAQYREATGEKLVVTSATRAIREQPGNAHQLSVHPAGMAIDLRVPASCVGRAWLENALPNLNRRGVIDGIRERHPPHYHVAVFPAPYAEYVEERLAVEAAARKAEAAEEAAQRAAADATGKADGGGAISVPDVTAVPAAAAGATPFARWAMKLAAFLAAASALAVRRYGGRRQPG